MSCARHEMQIMLHAHGQLGGISRLLVELHLESCPGCRARWAQCVVERDGLRRALTPMPLLDGRGRRLLDGVTVGVRFERAAGAEPPRIPERPLRRQILLLALVLLLTTAVSALAAYWEPFSHACGLRPGRMSSPVEVLPDGQTCPILQPELFPGSQGRTGPAGMIGPPVPAPQPAAGLTPGRAPRPAAP